jgi:hypothetical protein
MYRMGLRPEQYRQEQNRLPRPRQLRCPYPEGKKHELRQKASYRPYVNRLIASHAQVHPRGTIRMPHS